MSARGKHSRKFNGRFCESVLLIMRSSVGGFKNARRNHNGKYKRNNKDGFKIRNILVSLESNGALLMVYI